MKEIDIDERERMARANFHSGWNCCQAVLLAFNDIIGLTDVQVASLASGFGGGMGRMREVCGAVSAMTFMSGIISPSTDPSDQERRKANYALVQEMAASFKEENGSIICRELLGLNAGQVDAPVPSVRDAKYYATRTCEDKVGYAARIVATKLSLIP